jgi:hypothetical protein
MTSVMALCTVHTVLLVTLTARQVFAMPSLFPRLFSAFIFSLTLDSLSQLFHSSYATEYRFTFLITFDKKHLNKAHKQSTEQAHDD